MRPDPDLWLPPPGQGFPLLPGRKEELVTIKKGDGEGKVNNSKKRKPSRRGVIPCQNKEKKRQRQKITFL